MDSPDTTALTERVAGMIRMNETYLADARDHGVSLLVGRIRHELYLEWLRHRAAAAGRTEEAKEATHAGSV